MKKNIYLFKGITSDILKIWTDNCNNDIKKYIDRIESIDVKIKLNSIEALIARNQINKFNKKNNSKLRLFKSKK